MISLNKISISIKTYLFSFLVLFPFLTPVYEMLNICMFPKDSIEFFKKFVDRMQESRLDSNQKVKGGGFMRVSKFDNMLGCEQISCMLVADKKGYV